MAAVLSDHPPIKAVGTISGQTPQTKGDVLEKAGQTFLAGVPVMEVVSGSNTVIQEWNATVPASGAASVGGGGIAGVGFAPGANLASDGKGAPNTPFTSVGQPGTSLTFGKVPFQTSAVNIIPGSPVSDGRTLFEVANQDSIFEAMFDSADGNTTNATTTFAMEGKQFGLTKDATGHWYVDAQKTTQGTNTAVQCLQLHPNDGAKQNGRMFVKFISQVCQIAQ